MSKEAILEHIYSEAKKEAESIVSAASSRSAAKKEKSEKVFSAEYESKIVAVKDEADNAINGEMSLMRIESRKNELKVKRELIDKVYSLTEEKILSLSDEYYRAFLAGLISKYVEDGDKVILSKRDVKRVTKDYLSDLAFDLQIDFTMSDEVHNDKGGVILRGIKCDKNLTLSAIIKEARMQTENSVADKLFGS